MSTTTYITKQRTFIFPRDNVTFQTLTDLFFIHKKYRSCPNLDIVIRQLNFDFYHDLLPIIAQWASDHTQSNPVKPLQANITARVTYTSAQARYLLANAFFLNTTKGYGSIDLIDLYHVPFDRVAIERIRCLIEYFRLSSQQQDKNDDREISIERYSYAEELPDWKKQLDAIQESKVSVFAERMEASEEAQGFVDFANKQIHIHSITSSATQEEILCKILLSEILLSSKKRLFSFFLVSCCPEAFLAILVCDTLRSDEVVILRGCKRFSDYRGYGETFQFVGPYANQNPTHIQDILIMDACLSNHFSRCHIDRDLGKAWAAFAKARDEIIVTGNWGCGVFGGDPMFKFLQQVCAASVLVDTVKKLDYSAYGDDRLVSKLKDLMKQLEKKKKTVADVYRMMIKYGENEIRCFSKPIFSYYVNEWLNDS
ncbi:unnamed protein product [Rotaria sp. Silwood2]|nr:unnamed protein product [Rotaria sp. Silwood2]CAF4060049.1 unnamed protein product [Rotaria sp. Silwood2]